MPQAAGQGVLANLAIQKARVDKAKMLLGLSSRGVPQAQSGPPGKAPSPANSTPAQTAASPTAGAEEPQPLITTTAATQEEAHGHLRNQVAEFLQNMQPQPGAQPLPAQSTAPISSAPQTASMATRVAETGAQNLTPQEQFYRLAGRSPSPRELSIFSSRMLLEKQLGRPPTQIELRNYIMRPEVVSPAYPTVVQPSGR
jgi:hypothetical protein